MTKLCLVEVFGHYKLSRLRCNALRVASHSSCDVILSFFYVAEVKVLFADRLVGNHLKLKVIFAPRYLQ